MVIGFKPQFVSKILDGTKLNTIREDKNNRWKKGVKMHMATGVRTKNYSQFSEKVCKNVAKISILWTGCNVKIIIDSVQICNFNTAMHWSEHSNNGFRTLETFAKRDGFDDLESFLKWFQKDFEGKVIYWE